MAYYGNDSGGLVLPPQVFTSTGQTTFTLNPRVSLADVYVSRVLQSNNYYFSGNSLVFNTTITNGTEVIVVPRATVGRSDITTYKYAFVDQTGSSTTAYTASYTPANSSLTHNLVLGVKILYNSSVTLPTFSPDGLPAKPIVNSTGDLLYLNQLQAGSGILLRYDLPSDSWWIVFSGVQAGQTNVFTKGQAGLPYTLTDSATITPDFYQGNNFKVTLGGNRTLANPTNLLVGQSGIIDIVQDGTGSRTLTLDWGWSTPGGTAISLSTAALTRDQIAYYVGTSSYSTVTINNGTPGTITYNNHGLRGGEKVRFTTTGSLPTGLAINTTYFIKPVDNNSFQLSSTLGGASIAISGTQSGVHTLTAVSITTNLIKAVG